MRRSETWINSSTPFKWRGIAEKAEENRYCADVPTQIAARLATDDGFVSVLRSGNVALVMSGSWKIGNFVSFVLGKMCVVHSRQL